MNHWLSWAWGGLMDTLLGPGETKDPWYMISSSDQDFVFLYTLIGF